MVSTPAGGVDAPRHDEPVSTVSSAEIGDGLPSVDEGQWRALDDVIHSWWDDDIHHATERELPSLDARRRQEIFASVPPAGREKLAEILGTGLSHLFVPFPFITPGGAEGTFASMFAWDTYFINLGLLVHGRLDLVRDHIRNYLVMIERFGFMPNACVPDALTRSQTPVFVDSIWRYYLASGDRDLLYQAYPLLKREFVNYWNAAERRTSVGLTTNRDEADPFLPASLASEAETGLDWTPIYCGDVRDCAPLITNCALVRYAHTLALIGTEVGLAGEAAGFADHADTRAELIRKHCWNDDAGLFLEYDYVRGEQLPYVSACAYWPLWAKVATREQADRLVANIGLLENRYGLASTDKSYPDTRSRSIYSITDGEVAEDATDDSRQLQWMYPAGWAPEQLIVGDGLVEYGYVDAADRLARRFLAALLREYKHSGKLWEKYNVVDGTIEVPNARYGNKLMRGWTAAAAVILGRRVFAS